MEVGGEGEMRIVSMRQKERGFNQLIVPRSVAAFHYPISHVELAIV